MAQHRNGCQVNIRDTESGYGEFGPDFIRRFNIVIGFKIECLGCCLDYLVTERNYQRTVGSFDRVYFAVQDPKMPQANVSCFVRVPESRNGRYGQFATFEDINLGNPTIRVVQTSRTYQIYGRTGGMTVGTVINARMESLAIDKARLAELADMYVNYADAALVELYRINNNLDSFRGICTLTPVRNLNVAGLNVQDN